MTEALTRTEASEAVEDIGWRYLLGCLVTTVDVDSFARGAQVASDAVAACGADAEQHLRIDLRGDRVELSLQSGSVATRRDVELAHSITDVLRDHGFDTVEQADGRPVESLEIALDAMDIAAIRPFWKAVLDYVDEPGHDGPEDALIDPVRQLPALWFQQMDTPRTQRNRFHLDITVSHHEAERRIAAALAAGGHVTYDAEARAFVVLADVEGNEVCVCTWLDRDNRVKPTGILAG